MCLGCVVIVECLAHGLRYREPGIWGGTSERERRRVPRWCSECQARLPIRARALQYVASRGAQSLCEACRRSSRARLPSDAQAAARAAAAARRAKARWVPAPLRTEAERESGPAPV